MMRKLLILSLLALILILSGCAAEKPLVSPENALIAEDRTTAYVITRSDTADGELTKTAVDFRSALSERVGIDFTLKTDFYKEGNPSFAIPDCEILVGKNNRDVTAELSEKAPRNADWLIARSGTKVLIYGDKNLGDAIAYFLENYVVDGNIYVPDGELYVHTGEYKFDSLTLGGVDIGECTIGFMREGGAEELASEFAQALSSDSGRTVKTKAYSSIPGDKTNTIFFMIDSEIDPMAISCRGEGSTFYVTCGFLASLEDCYAKLLEQIEAKAADKKLELNTISFTEKGSDERLNVADAAFMASLEKKQQEMKDSVMNTESQYEVGENGRIFYFANDGDDSNDGLSPEKPLKTLDKLLNMSLRSGDVVLFKRGDIFRGRVGVKQGVTYSAYGEGAKPIISGSRQNFADPALWEKTEYANVWVCTEELVNVGIVALDHTGEIGKYDELVGTRMVRGLDGFEGVQSMNEDLQVWSNLDDNRLYFYSEKNPGERFKSIEIGERANLFSGGAANVTIDNLHITNVGAHGVGCSGNKNLTVRNCLFNWLGGSILGEAYKADGSYNTTGYGNAVQIYGSVDGFHVYNNWMYQIYDTGITHQYSETPSTKVNNHLNVEYHDNLIEYCFWFIEYYNASSGEGTERKTINVNVHDNYCRMGGPGWGCRGRSGGTPMYCIGSQADVTENYVTANNIFENCVGYLVTTYGAPLEGDYTFSNNTYVQPYGAKFINCEGVAYFDSTAADALEEKLGEVNPRCYFILPEG